MDSPLDKARWYIGTMGFSYKDWSGAFYPDDLAARGYLSYYSRVFNAVEIDSTFYGTPKSEVVQRWVVSTPDDFKFCVKVPRAITHDLSLTGAGGLMDEFIQTIRLLGDKLGVILLQFPPSFHASQSAVLENFLGELPGDLRFAVEIRHRSWYTAGDETDQLLARYGVGWAATEYPGLPRRIRVTAGFLYLRWIGQHGSFKDHTHERIDRSPELQIWWEQIQKILDQVDSVYGFFNNDYAGFGVGTANRFKEITGLPVAPLRPPQQGKLL